MTSRISLMMTLALALAACGSTDAAADGGREELIVSAAASLTDVFGEMESVFEEFNPGVDVLLNLAGSASLREQILEGAPADVFAPADLSNMDRVVAAGKVDGDPQIFARNALQIAVPAGNPAGVTGLADFVHDDLLIGLCAKDVPCGGFAREVLANARVTPAIDTNEPDVRALLTKIELGELDAGITYVTDIESAGGRVEGIAIPEAMNVAPEYPIATLIGAGNRDGAAAFVDFVFSGEGRAILSDHGFATP